MNQRTLPRWATIAVLLVTLAVIAAVFYVLPLPSPAGDDWGTLRLATWHFFGHAPLYGETHYISVPYVALLLTPLSIWPEHAGFALVDTLSIGLLIWLGARYHAGGLKAFCLVCNPALIFILYHGQIDVLILSSVAWPALLRPIAAVAKPQCAGGLLVRARPRDLLPLAALLALSFALYPSWPIDMQSYIANRLIAVDWNLVGYLWPFQWLAAVPLLIRAYRQKDDLLALAASPLLLPYATIGSFIGIWFVVCCRLAKWEIALLTTLFWAATIYRLIS